MNDVVATLPALAAGLFIGVAFFGGLWWTVRKGITSSRSAWWFAGSFLARIGLATGGFYFVSRGDFARLVACLLGFMTGRALIIRLTKSFTMATRPCKESSHAP